MVFCAEKTLVVDGDVPSNTTDIAFTISDRSEKACRHLWGKVPAKYRSAAVGALVCKTLSFSKSDAEHHMFAK